MNVTEARGYIAVELNEYSTVGKLVDSFEQDDEGIECPIEISLEHAVQDCEQTTPEAVSMSASLCDSGFAESIAGCIELQCLECVWEWSASKESSDSRAKCTCTNNEHDGFEEYVHEIFMHRLKLESKYHVLACLENQPEISIVVRKTVIEWLTSAHHDLKLCQDTLYLAVHVFDRVLDVMQVSRDCLELLAITCLLVASKQNEICPPEIHELLEKCHDVFTREQVKQLEMIVLMATSFDLLAPTVQQFLEYFAAACLQGCLGDEEQTMRLKMARAVSRCVLELSLPDYRLCQFRPSVLALCVLAAAVEYLKTHLDLADLRQTIGAEAEEFNRCLSKVRSFIDNFRQTCPDMTALCEKYAGIYGSK